MRQLFSILSAILVVSSAYTHAQTITTIAGNGTWDFYGDGGPASAAALGFPFAVFVTPSGGLYVADEWNNRIRYINPAGIITTFAGDGTTAWASEGVPATTVGISFPRSVCVDAMGNVYIGDEGNQRVRKVTPAGLIYNAAGNGSMAYSGDGGPATDASIYGPYGVCTDAGGNLYIGESSNYVVRKVNTAGVISTFAGNGTAGYGGDGGPATAANFTGAAGLCFDASGNMYVADYTKVRKISASGIITTVAGTGTLGYSGDGGPATAAMINDIYGICLDADGNLYIADHGNNVIRKVTSSGVISTYAGTGTAGFSGDNGPATAAMLNGASGVTIDGMGNLYIADYNNQRIRKVTRFNASVGGTGATGVVVNVYPNPASSTIFIECKQSVNACITSLDGRVMIMETSAQKVDVSQLAPGNYLLRVTDPQTGVRLYHRVFMKE